MLMAVLYRAPLPGEFRLDNALAPDSWPPAYSIRKSPRARKIRLKISRRHGLEIVIPQRLKSYNAEQLLHQHRRWIERYLPAHHPSKPELPLQLHLAAIGETWQVAYLPAQQDPLLTIDHGTLQLHGITDPAQACTLLKRWLRIQAYHHLTSLIAAVSQETGLTYQQLTIRLQSCRWGSCSRRNTISLNAKLLFLPAALVRHVIIHELCHTVHLNHSQAFWELVAKFDADCMQHRKALNKAEHYIPHWVER